MERRQIIIMFLSLSFIQQKVTGSVILNGDKVADSEMQYMASLQSKQAHVCGAVLVRDDFVLTAAHCADQHPDTVVLGTHDLKKSKNRQRIKIIKPIKHPSYEKRNKGNDLMLLKLKTKVEVTNSVQIVQLPDEKVKVEVGERCEVAGWGATEISGAPVKDLMATKVSIMDVSTCKNKWHDLPPDTVCASRNNNIRTFSEDDCGGPLVCNNIAVGIASFNRNLRIEGPNVFVDISKYLEWINQTINASYNEQ